MKRDRRKLIFGKDREIDRDIVAVEVCLRLVETEKMCKDVA